MTDDNNKENNDRNDATERLRDCAINYATALDAYLGTTQPKQESLDPDVLKDAVAEQLSEHDFGDQIQDAVDGYDFSYVVNDALGDVDIGDKIDEHFYYNKPPLDEDRVAEIVTEGFEVKLFEHHLGILQDMDNYDHWQAGIEGAAVNRYKAEQAEKEKAKEEECQSAG